MQEYLARLVSVVDGGVIYLDIDLGLCNVHVYKRVYLKDINIPSIDSCLPKDKNQALAAKQRLTDLLAKAEGGVLKIKTEEEKGNIFVTVYIGGMNVNKTLANDCLTKNSR